MFGGLFLHEVGIVGLGKDSTIGEAFALFFRMAGGGAGIGVAFAVVLRFILYKLDRCQDKEEVVLQVTATVTIAYLSFFISEVVAGCSGVISVVTTGIFTKAFAAGLISDWRVMDSFWSLLEHLLNTVIFALGGTAAGGLQGRVDGYSSVGSVVSIGDSVYHGDTRYAVKFRRQIMHEPLRFREGQYHGGLGRDNKAKRRCSLSSMHWFYVHYV